MSKTAPVSVSLEADLNEQLLAIANALDRPKSWVIEEVVRSFVAMQAWQLAAIDEGIHAADSGRVVAHEDVLAWVQSWDAPDELPAPSCEWLWTVPALADLASARTYIAGDDPLAAARTVMRILDAVASLVRFPESGRPNRRAGTCALVVGRTSYLVPITSAVTPL